MTPEYAVGLLGLFASACAGIALVWALRRRQLQTDDQAMYEAVADDEPDFGAAPPLVKRRTHLLFALIFVILFGLIGLMTMETVRVASRGAAGLPVLSGANAGK